MLEKSLTIDLGDRSYPIFIGPDTWQQDLSQWIQGHQVAIVTNTTVAPLYLDTMKAKLQAYQVIEVILPDGEAYKNLEHIQQIFDEMMRHRCHRNVTVIALGGGVIGDMAGFAAACYQRGCPFIQLPTTLLSQVDSSVGGKTGVNHPLGKNMIGAFYQPKSVLINTNTLKTLPQREFSAGLAEVLKYGLGLDASFYAWLDQHRTQIWRQDEGVLIPMIEKCCSIKAQVVADDEREQGKRALLNLGHTFAHAIEQLLGYGTWLHGEAVGLGLLMAADLSCQLGKISPEAFAHLKQWLVEWQLPSQWPKELSETSVAEVMTVMRSDKKNQDDNIRLVLLEATGESCVSQSYPQALLERLIFDYIRQTKQGA